MLDVTVEIIVLRVYKFSILSHQIDLNRAAVVIFYTEFTYTARWEKSDSDSSSGTKPWLNISICPVCRSVVGGGLIGFAFPLSLSPSCHFSRAAVLVLCDRVAHTKRVDNVHRITSTKMIKCF